MDIYGTTKNDKIIRFSIQYNCESLPSIRLYYNTLYCKELGPYKIDEFINILIQLKKEMIIKNINNNKLIIEDLEFMINIMIEQNK